MLSKSLCGLLLLASICSFGQTNATPSSQEVPILRGADLPQYPPIAEAAHFTGHIAVRVTVKAGKVARTEIVTAEVRDRSHAVVSEAAAHWLSTPTIENLHSWRFDSTINNVFVVNYTYNIAGTATSNPTNSRVGISPLLDVKITARPVKPVVEY